ncbi:MAG: hypothetical protein K1060chlam5_01011 [Candidatus Anoxychlamydiales bacterium]|nr:hypothetical protein [Candidatus Anoxychlamydiales bacterium]
MKNKDRKVITISIILSITIHLIAIASINNHPMKQININGKNITFAQNAKSYIDKKNPNDLVKVILKEKKKNLYFGKNKNNSPNSQSEKDFKIILQSNDSYIHKDYLFNLPNDQSHKNLIKHEKKLSSLDIQTNSNDELIDSIKKDSNKKILKTQKQKNKSYPKKEKKLKQALSFNADKRVVNVYYKNKYFISSDLKNDSVLVSSLKKINLHNFSILNGMPPILDMPKLDDLLTLSYKNFFDIDVSFTKDVSSDGYLFAITFVPKNNLKLKRLKQNVFFLLDRSNSIQEDRLSFTRHAIASSISSLNTDDTFNIIAFDKKLDVLSTNNLSPSHSNVTKARKFLRDQKIGSFFSSTNLSIPLYKILDTNVKDDEINVAILLSDGGGLNKVKNSKIINSWTKKNKGNLVLYSINLQEDKNKSALELFSILNKGKLITSTTNRQLRKKLNRLVQSISYPIAKNLLPTSICLDNSVNIELYPSSNQLPHLYLDEPYVILGSINKLEDFTVFLQGKCGDRFLNIKKHISFDKAKIVGNDLQKQIALYRANQCFEKYLHDLDQTHLKDADLILEPYDLKSIFR